MSPNERPKVVVVTGPTATGKSEAAHLLAREFNGELINADSVQIYRRLDIGTSKPDAQMRGECAYHLLDIRDPDEPFNAETYRRLAREAVASIAGGARVPIVVGGCGFYIRALLQGFFQGVGPDPEVRARLQARQASEGTPALHRELQTVDPASASRIHPHDTHRILRALEVWITTGRPISEWQRTESPPRHAYDVLYLVLDRPRAALRERIGQRVRAMIRKGWVEEVQALIRLGYDESCRPLRSVGYADVLAYCRGHVTAEEMASRIDRATVALARRQTTWFRKEADAQWVEATDHEALRDRVERFLKVA
ncbi:MAG: tRNA (adenosine(37)-N6)-dimethylallyltransferase MiaA [Nitrospirae bacterium]|nr:tRNA (adenosine(37)-N6)-dimethylallyltransferase MiaA [Nitrospirota bacterium]